VGVKVGSGTDPAEGAALAGAILERLAGQALLTFATTHHAELKDMPVRSPASSISITFLFCLFFILLSYYCYFTIRALQSGGVKWGGVEE
jgi:hypothetical protein